MKIVVLHPPLYPVNHTFYNILGKYAEVVVYSFGEYPKLHQHWSVHEMKKKAINYNIKIFGKGRVTLKTQLNPMAIRELIIDKPDIVISVAFWFPSLYASLFKKLLGYKFLITTDATIKTDSDISFVKQNIRKLIAKNTDLFISASLLTTKYLSNLFPKSRIKNSLQTIDVTEWTKEFNLLQEKDKLRKQLDLPRDKVILLGVGGFTSGKNWMSIFKQIDKIENTIFVLIGAGELANEYHTFINSSNLTSKVKIVTRKEGVELKKYFKLSDIFIFPTLSDRFGYVVLEALASGLPVICSKNSGASSLIVNGKNGFIVDPNAKYIEEIELIIKDINTFQKEAIITMEQYTLEKKVDEWLSMFKKLKSEQ